VPGTPPPEELLQAVAQAAQDPANCRYGPVIGELGLRSGLVNEMKNIYGSDVDLYADDVVITAGCNMAFAAAVLAIATAGDEVILPVPWYVILARVFDLLIDIE
jgi:aspartate/methionine/tyrosine aminotransferase